MLYLASPYTHVKRSVRYQRFIATALATAKLINEGKVVYSPIVHNHSLVELVGLPKTWKFWKAFDTEMLSKAERFMILKLEGWAASTGVTAETEIAVGLGLVPEFMEEVV